MRSAPRPVPLAAALVLPALLLTTFNSSSPVPVVNASPDAPATTASDDRTDAPRADPSTTAVTGTAATGGELQISADQAVQIAQGSSQRAAAAAWSDSARARAAPSPRC